MAGDGMLDYIIWTQFVGCPHMRTGFPLPVSSSPVKSNFQQVGSYTPSSSTNHYISINYLYNPKCFAPYKIVQTLTCCSKTLKMTIKPPLTKQGQPRSLLISQVVLRKRYKTSKISSTIAWPSHQRSCLVWSCLQDSAFWFLVVPAPSVLNAVCNMWELEPSIANDCD